MSRYRDLRDLYGRGLIGLLVLDSATAAREAAAVLAERLPDATVVLVHEDRPDGERITGFNRNRDALLRSGRSVILVAGSGDDARFARRTAPDLTAVLDLSAEITGTRSLPWPEVELRLRELHRRTLAAIDLTGLVAHAADPVDLPLLDVYITAAGLPPSARLDVPSLVVGPPGAGKTTTLRWLALRHARGEESLISSDRTPVVVPLAAWAAQARDRVVPLAAFVDRYVARVLDVDTVALREHAGRVVLLLDGLDEVTGVADRRLLLDQASQLAQQGAWVVVSGREHVVDDLNAEQSRVWKVTRLRAPQLADAGELVHAVLRVRLARRPEAIEPLRRELVGHPDFHHFAANPLLVTFLTLLAELQHRVPSQRTELYHDLVEMLISSWRRLRNQDGARQLRRADVLRVVAPLGWLLVERGVGGISEADLLAELTRVEAAMATEGARDRAVVRMHLLREDTALIGSAGGLWRFHHPTIAEYLAARCAGQDERRLDALCHDPYDPRFTQVMAFALAHATDIEPRMDLARRLLEALQVRARRAGVYDAKIPRTIITCLTEAHGVPGSARSSLAERALDIALRKKLTPWRREEALVALGQLCRSAAGPVRDVIARYLVDGVDTIDWEAMARDTRSRDVTPPLYQLGDLPEWLTLAGLDPMPLLRRWVRSEETLLRAVVWYPWVCESSGGMPRLDRRKQWETADPSGLSSVVLDGWSFPAPPVDRTPALRARFSVS
ncbi:MAG TPA: NACHT domain-containing protein [Myxococcota bacterium]|nr:NACHT domain-containing protein [Myxococcota bacterium]